MKIDHRLLQHFTGAAITGLCTHHAALVASGKPGHVTPEDVASRAFAVGKAAAEAFASMMEAEEEAATRPDARDEPKA